MIVVVLGVGTGRVVGRVRKALAAVNGALDKAGIKPADVTQERVAADRRLVEIKERLAELDRRQGLYNFVLERAGSADYRSQFGLISVVRGDLESLARQAGQGRHSTGGSCCTSTTSTVARRAGSSRCCRRCTCSWPSRSSSSWSASIPDGCFARSNVTTRRCCRPTSSDDGAFGSDDDRLWESTPQNYLEKIFQIPFALRPMSSTGFGRLVDQLTSSAVSAPGDRGNGQRG